ncbi:MAG: His-Xaa-Ser system radical SAM maturase HxsB [Deltaproteobacteria bacterium]
MPVTTRAANKTGYFNFRVLDGGYLLTNDWGDHCFLDDRSFDGLLNGQTQRLSRDTFLELREKGFLREKADLERFSERVASKNRFLGQGTSLHIVVVTLRCNYRCSYCQAGSADLSADGLDMDAATAHNIVDRIFESPSSAITIEFQGGEPLANVATLRSAVVYARQKNRKAKKNLLLTVVTNLGMMNAETLAFLTKNKVHVCTSLDGPAFIHDRLRRGPGNKGSHAHTVKWIRALKKEYARRGVRSPVSALPTITRLSLGHAEEIVKEYVNLGLDGIHLRQMSPFGLSKNAWEKLGVPADDFVRFYESALDHILELNKKGRYFSERLATVFLTKILTDQDPNYLDLRSPCGAGTGQLAYLYDGSVYACDEARMLGRSGDAAFRLGDARKDSWRDLMNHAAVKTLSIASCLHNLPGCSQCAYRPYCGVCPLHNYALQGDVLGKPPVQCKVNMAILDYLFRRLKDKKNKEVFLRWVNGKNH